MRVRTSYNALLPEGPVKNVDDRMSSSETREWRLPAQIATPSAIMKTSAPPISSRYDMLSPHQLLRRCPERRVLVRVTRHRSEQMAIQLRDERRERRARACVEPRLAHVLGRGLRRVEAHRLALVQLQHDGQEQMAGPLRIAALGGELARERAMRTRVADEGGTCGGGLRAPPRRRPDDPHHDIAHVHEDHDERDDEQTEHDVETDGMHVGQMVHPRDQIVPRAPEPPRQRVALDPLVLGSLEDLTKRPPQGVGGRRGKGGRRGWGAGEGGGGGRREGGRRGWRLQEGQRAPSCWLRICRSNASRRTRES